MFTRRFVLFRLIGLGSVVGALGYLSWRYSKVHNVLKPLSNEDLSAPSWLCPKESNASVIFIGDSRVSRWAPLPVFRQGLTIVNRGVGGETLRSLSARFQRDALLCRPQAIVLQAGINDLVGASFLDANESESICSATIAKLIQLAEDCANVGIKLLIMSIIPPGRPTFLYRVEGVAALSQHVARVNNALSRVNWPRNVQFLDLRQLLTNDDRLTLRREFQDDTLHLSAAGYEAVNRLLLISLL